jgi:glycosyltransferase involved in cell wall biosynthesis
MSPLRITFVMALAWMDGGTRVISIYADRLRRRGHDVRVVSRAKRLPGLRSRMRTLLTSGHWPRQQRYPSHLDAVAVPHRILPAGVPITEADVPDGDVVIATWWETAEWVAGYGPSKGAPVYFLQGYDGWGANPVARVDATWRLPLHKIAVAQWLVDRAAQYGDTQVSLVPNSVDTVQFHAPPRGKQARPTVGLLYTAIPAKGIDLALAALRQARRDVPNLHVIAFGHEELDPRLPLPPGAEYYRNPPQDQLKELYARCDAWLFPSRAEGFGLPILEAMACRTPVLAMPAGAAPELLARGGGRLVPAGDAAALATAIRELAALAEPAWCALSNAALATVTRYSWDDAAERFEAALRLALARHSVEGAPR